MPIWGGEFNRSTQHLLILPDEEVCEWWGMHGYGSRRSRRLSGANNTHIVTLVERHTRFAMLLKVPSKDTATVVGALGKHVRKLPQQLRRSLTWDRGKEMADHKSFTIATNVRVYFCDPRSPWQRGSNENTNGLLRQYFPRGTDLSRFSQAHLNRIALRLNQRPRKTLGFETPADRLRAVLH
jgi:IS30 family transposase